MIITDALPLDAPGVRVRRLRHDDAESFARGTEDPAVREFGHLPLPTYTPEIVREQIDGVIADGLHRGDLAVLAIADPDTDELLGSLVLFDIRPGRAEIGFWVAPWGRGRGVARAAVAAAGRIAAANGLTHLDAHTSPENEASIQVLVGAGLHQVGGVRTGTAPSGHQVDLLYFEQELAPGPRSSEDYMFRTASELGRHHMAHLEAMFDAPSRQVLAETGVGPGSRILELGAGGGSIARWLAERNGPDGRVVAVDLAADQLAEQPGLEVHSADLNDGLPVAGPYDLIHARLVLMHLPRRQQILTELVDALAPGGWLVLGEFVNGHPEALRVPSQSDRALWDKIQHLAHRVIGPAAGQDWDWGRAVADRMEEAGLAEVEGIDFRRMTRGGSPGCLLHLVLVAQAEQFVRAAGVTEEELTRYDELLRDPDFRAWFYAFVCTRGRKPLQP
ncbi:MAG: GNAT family N-acetyltransferase [Propionibacteriaceae bacterium]